MAIGFEKLSGTEPVYSQLVRQVKDRIASGRLSSGDPLPSRRELAAELGINPNTVQKAYKLLEDEGLVATMQSSHSVVTASPEAVEELRISSAADCAREFSARMKELGFDFRETVGVLGDSWE